MNKSNNFKSSFCLSLTAVIWGVAFVFQSMGNNYMPAQKTCGIRRRGQTDR